MISTPWFALPPEAYGGIEAMCAELVDGLVELGHRVTVIGVGRNGTKGRFTATDDKPAGSRRLGNSRPEVLHAARTARVLRSLDSDVIHDHSMAGPLQAGQRQAPTVVTAHGPVTGEMGLYYRALSDTVHMVALSRAQQAQAPDIHWSGQVHNALRSAHYPYRDRKGDNALFLGRIAADKGVHLAIDAAREAELPLTVAGNCNDPSEQPYIEAEIRPRVGDDVHLVGEVDWHTKLDLLASARCLLFPIQWEEPFGMVMIEAMACGTPVVALRRGSVPEIVEEGVTGYICDHPAELAKAIGSVDRLDPVACRGRVRRHFDTDQMAAAYAALYQQLSRRHPHNEPAARMAPA
ncbi:glycosyltransferase family 4 protein [Streptomyces sp. NPDC047860]|uniref:glycosyltransferase family 4 protein n=1 Tax=Streptomyces sp. NPDC047860 TaxID=3155743 RepID=UPI0033FB3F76